MSHQVGGDRVNALAEINDHYGLDSLTPDLVTFGGGGIGSFTSRSSQFLGALADYDVKLNQYQDLKNHRASPATLTRSQQQLKQAYRRMQSSFGAETKSILNKHVARTAQRRNARGRMVSKFIPVSSGKEAQNLARLAKFGRIAGPGLIAVDGALRYRKVYQMRRGGDSAWKREAVAQSAGFTAGILAGSALVLIVAMSPAGIILGAVAAGMVAVGLDYVVQGAARSVYDSIY